MIKKQFKFIFLFLFFLSFFSFIFLDQVKAEFPNCCYGFEDPGEPFCIFEKDLPPNWCLEGKVLHSEVYSEIRKGSCLAGNNKCLELMNDGGVQIKTEKDSYVGEIGDEINIFFPSVSVFFISGAYPNYRLKLFVKNADNFFIEDSLILNTLTTDLSFGTLYNEYLTNKNIRINIAKLVKNLDIKTLPYSFSLIIFGEITDEVVYRRYGAKEIKIEIKPKACGLYLEQKTCDNNPFCIWASEQNSCYSNMDVQTCTKLNRSECTKMAPICKIDSNGDCQSALTVAIEDSYGSEVPEGYTGFLPDCAFKGNCKDVNQFLNLAIGVIRWIFGIIGGLALIMFVYGGLLMIISFGNEEKVKQGKSAIIAAVVGLIIVFGAYMLVNFLLFSLGVASDLNILQ